MTMFEHITRLETVSSFIVIIIIVMKIYYTRAFAYWKVKNIPYLEPTIPFGTAPNPLTTRVNLGVSIQKAYVTLRSTEFKYAGIYLITVPKIFVVDPGIIKSILQADFSYFTERGFYHNAKDDPLSANLFALGGEKWRRIRVNLSPTFTSGKLKMMFETLLQCGYKLKNASDDFCKTQRPINVKEISVLYGMEVISSCAFGLESNIFTNVDSEFRKQGKKIFDFGSLVRLFKTIFAFVFPDVARRLGITLFDKNSIKFFTGIVRDTVNFRETNKVIRNDMIQLLIESKKNAPENGKSDSFRDENVIKELAAQVFIFFAAGFETSSTTLSYCLYELAANPDIEKKLRGEINNVLAKHGEEISYDSIMEMKYMNQVVEETLRKYPPVSFITRVCVKNYTIPGTDDVVEKGTEIVFSILGLHRDAQYYPEPEKFDPDRFNEENKRQRVPFTYLPFGEGPRICIGARFALMQIKVALAMLLMQYKFSVNKQTVEPIEFEIYSFTIIPSSGIFLNIDRIAK